jgi:penicillin-binding protein A
MFSLCENSLCKIVLIGLFVGHMASKIALGETSNSEVSVWTGNLANNSVSNVASVVPLTNEKQMWSTPFGQVSWSEISEKLDFQSDGVYTQYKSMKLKLTLEPDLQRSIQHSLDSHKNISGGVVLLESKTGRILAIAEKKSDLPNPLNEANSIVTAARAPAASLLKIVTATAAMEKTGIEPEDDVYFHGGCGYLRNQNWLKDSLRDVQHLSLAKAFGVSCNTAFARLAIYDTGLSSWKTYAHRYYFNRPIPSDLRFETSTVQIPSLESATALEVGEVGSGFVASRISPIHSAMLSAATGNNGVLMAPFIVDTARNVDGKIVYKGEPRAISRVFSKGSSLRMIRLMQDTVLSGTSRKFFRKSGTSKDRYEIGGKTGTLSDAEERGILYTWFSGLAPLDSPDNVSIGALVASPKTWVVRASSLAQLSFSQYLKWDKLDKKIVAKPAP